MLRIASSVVVAAASMALSAAGAAAANPPSPPPGTVTAQPMSVTAGSSSQPGGGVSASTGTTGAYSDGQNPSASHCGVQASAGSNGYSAQPASIGSSGTGTPTCSTAAGSGSGATSTSTQGQGAGRGAGAGSGAGGTTQTDATPTGWPAEDIGLSRNLLLRSSSLDGASGLWPGILVWIGLALLALLFILLGVAIGRRRKAEAPAHA